jgi:gamma-glutamyltranspeptidase/glutathione hydrolase
MRIRGWLVGAVAFVALLAQPSAQSTTSWRPTVVATHGMVAAGHPLAAEAGLRILKAGGNAVDAAVATWAVQGEVEPGMTGLGSDMFMLIYLAKTGEVKFINGTGFAPQAATIDFYKSKGGLPDEGPLSIAVPGAVGGAAFALRKYGTRPLADVLAPAIEIADQGFPITEALAGQLTSGRNKLQKWPSTTKLWFKDGKPLQTGDLLVNPDLARTLRAIASQGPDAFYRGDLAKNTAAFVKKSEASSPRRTSAATSRSRTRRSGPIPRDRRLRVPAEFAGLRDARGAQHPRGLRPARMGHNRRPTCTP